MSYIIPLLAIVGTAILAVSTYIYFRSPEHGKGGWGLCLVGFLMVSISLFESFELTSDGVKARLQKTVVEVVKDETGGTNAELERLRKQYGSLKTQVEALEGRLVSGDDQEFVTAYKNIEQTKDNATALTPPIKKALEQVNKSEKGGFVLLREVDKALNLEPTVFDSNLGQLEELIAQVNFSSDPLVKSYYEEKVPEILRKLAGMSSSKAETIKSSLIQELNAQLLALESNPDKTALKRYIASVGDLQVFEEYAKISFELQCRSQRLAYDSYGSAVNFDRLLHGDLIALSSSRAPAPLRDGTPTFGFMAPQIGTLQTGGVIRVLDTYMTKAIGARWLKVAVECSHDSGLVGKVGWVAWFNDRFVRF